MKRVNWLNVLRAYLVVGAWYWPTFFLIRGWAGVLLAFAGGVAIGMWMDRRYPFVKEGQRD